MMRLPPVLARLVRVGRATALLIGALSLVAFLAIGVGVAVAPGPHRRTGVRDSRRGLCS